MKVSKTHSNNGTHLLGFRRGEEGGWGGEAVIFMNFLVGECTLMGRYYANLMQKNRKSTNNKRRGKLG